MRNNPVSGFIHGESNLSALLNSLVNSSPPIFSSLLIVYEGADDSIPTPMDSIEACCSLENCCVDSEDLAKLAAAGAATSTEEEDLDEEDDHEHDQRVGDQADDDISAPEEEVTADCCYDMDNSLDSADVPLSSASHEDHHHGQTMESQLRNRHRNQKQQQQKLQLNNDCRRVVSETGKTFIPFSEETMFCDSSDMAPPHNSVHGHHHHQSAANTNENVDTSSPVSSDSWMNYSSHSSDDYSFIMDGRNVGNGQECPDVVVGGGERHRRVEESPSVVPKNKRNRDSFKYRKAQSIDGGDAQRLSASGTHVSQSVIGGRADREDEVGDDDDDDGDNESVDETLAHLQINQPKRLRGKEPTGSGIGGGAAGSGNSTGGGVMGVGGRKSVNSSRRSSTNTQQLVDIRIIDFAHTAFAKRNSNAGVMMEPKAETTAAAVHNGPDCGFLTGVDSLKRLLQEILPGGAVAVNEESADTTTSKLIMSQ